MTDPATSPHDGVADLLLLLGAARRARPRWWTDADQRDTDADQRDGRGRRRDGAADQRDTDATGRDTDAAARERAAVDLAVGAYARLHDQDAAAVDLLVDHVADLAQVRAAVERLAVASTSRAGAPVAGPFAAGGSAALDKALTSIELHVDRVDASLHAMGIERNQMRADLRGIAQHLEAAGRERLTAARERAAAAADRDAARGDREHALADRQQAALHRSAEL